MLRPAELARVPIMPGIGGAPTWPVGLQGSMTHCAGYAAAAVGLLRGSPPSASTPSPTHRFPMASWTLSPHLPNGIASPGLSRRHDSPNWDRLLFSAKEAVYKAWFPLVSEWLDHQEAEIVIDPQDGTFAALLARDGLIVDGRQVRRLHGRWARKRGILVTAVVLGTT